MKKVQDRKRDWKKASWRKGK